MNCERCEEHEATHGLTLTTLDGVVEDREKVCASCAKAAGLTPAPSAREADSRYVVVDLDTNEKTPYESLDEAHGGIEYDRLARWQIWQGQVLLESR